MIKVRLATPEDRSTLVRFSEEFVEEAKYNLPFDPGTAWTVLGGMQMTGLLFVAELEDGHLVGFIGGVLFPLLFNAKFIVGQELVWWVKPEFRGTRAAVMLLNALETAVKDAGAQAFVMVSQGEYADRVGEFYQRRGYVPREQAYMRIL